MAMDKPKKLAELTPLQEGEFWRIPHIAEKTSQKLHDAGIITFAELARLTPDMVAGIVGGVGTKQKCLEFDWLGQAADFAAQLKKQTAPALPPSEGQDEAESDPAGPVDAPSPTERRHLVAYVVELLMDNDQHVIRTTVSLANRTAKGFWSGWDPLRLSNWIAEQAHLPVQPVNEPANKLLNRPVEEAAVLSQVTERAGGAPASVPPANEAAVMAEKRPIPTAPVENTATEPETPRSGLAGEIAVLDVKAFPRGLDRPARIYKVGQPLELRLTLDTSRLSAPAGQALRYRVEFYARRQGSDRSLRLAQAQGVLPSGNQALICVPVAGLADGSYRLEANVFVYLPSMPHPDREGLRTFFEGILLQALPEKVR